jgi:chromosome segregation ATPase
MWVNSSDTRVAAAARLQAEIERLQAEMLELRKDRAAALQELADLQKLRNNLIQENARMWRAKWTSEKQHLDIALERLDEAKEDVLKMRGEGIDAFSEADLRGLAEQLMRRAVWTACWSDTRRRPLWTPSFPTTTARSRSVGAPQVG